MKNHVFLMQVHKEPKLVARILHRLEATNHYFIVNIDEKVPHYEYARFGEVLNGISNVILNERRNVIHGGFSYMSCTLDQIQLVYSAVPDFNYIHTISGQCYPCVSQNEFDDFFEKNNKSFTQQDSISNLNEWKKEKYPKRLEHWHLDDIFNKKWMIKCKLPRILNKLLRPIHRPYNYWDSLWGGGIGFLLNIQYVII